MLEILKIRSFRHLFMAQIVALLGTGLATVALGLLAYDLSGQDAGMVLGIVFGIKMVAYVGIAPVAGAFANYVPRRTLLVALDCVRGFIACLLPFVGEVWQIFVLIFVMQAASAAFTPTFQATLPDILPEEKDYTRALSLSRLAYDLESIITPTLAAFVLIFASYHALFYGTAIGFIGSGLLIVSVLLPSPAPDSKRRSVYERTTRGIRIYFATPRLRGLLALCMVVASIGAMVLVNTVVLVQSELGLDAVYVAYTLGAFGGGSMLVALVMPRLLDHLPDRQMMLTGASIMVATLAALFIVSGAGHFSWLSLLVSWVFVGAGYSAVLTPSGRLLQRSSHKEDRPALYAAQFALSHACWLISYPLSGFLQTRFGMDVTLGVLSLIGFISLVAASQIWPAKAKRDLYHTHPDLPDNHPHLEGSDHTKGHSHTYVIDDYHTQWPHR
ncbi:MFS transporter [Cohaesibacter celericrescens]|uniref:MFS transporter n=1 Tax=Cohaesibacter celericrescens TaxID=2067669 RepID=UPI0035613C2B